MTSILKTIYSPQDLQNLKIPQLQILAQEIREKIVETVAVTGGHLAPNLGVVELTLALHRVFNTSVDRIIWDVGHQSYVHKLLTGRQSQFGTLRQYGGISGFPRPMRAFMTLLAPATAAPPFPRPWGWPWPEI